jgi:hypothetical protein
MLRPAGWSGSLLLAGDDDRFRQSLLGGSGTPSIHSNRSTIAFEGGSGPRPPR